MSVSTYHAATSIEITASVFVVDEFKVIIHMKLDIWCLAVGICLPVLSKLLFLDDGTEKFPCLHLIDVFCLGVDITDSLFVKVLAETFHVVCTILAAPISVAD